MVRTQHCLKISILLYKSVYRLSSANPRRLNNLRLRHWTSHLMAHCTYKLFNQCMCSTHRGQPGEVQQVCRRQTLQLQNHAPATSCAYKRTYGYGMQLTCFIIDRIRVAKTHSCSFCESCGDDLAHHAS